MMMVIIFMTKFIPRGILNTDDANEPFFSKLFKSAIRGHAIRFFWESKKKFVNGDRLVVFFESAKNREST